MKFNMTPLIDVGFLLIIFFVLVCQYIVAENFPVTVPDKCRFAQSAQTASGDIITVTVMKADGQETARYAVGSEIITASDGQTIAAKIAEAINARLKKSHSHHAAGTVVCLRADKDVTYDHAQYALAGIAQSSATNIRLAVFKHKQADSQ